MPAENLFLSIVDFNATQLLRRVLGAISVRKSDNVPITMSFSEMIISRRKMTPKAL